MTHHWLSLLVPLGLYSQASSTRYSNVYICLFGVVQAHFQTQRVVFDNFLAIFWQVLYPERRNQAKNRLGNTKCPSLKVLYNKHYVIWKTAQIKTFSHKTEEKMKFVSRGSTKREKSSLRVYFFHATFDFFSEWKTYREKVEISEKGSKNDWKLTKWRRGSV